jgi:hypothetical protein
MQCAAWPYRQGTVSCSTCVEAPKYPPAMSALIEGNSLREPQRSQRAGSPKQRQPSRLARQQGWTDAVWTVGVLRSAGVPHDFYARLAQ